MKRLLIIPAFSLLTHAGAIAQDETDALRYSVQDIGGSAHYNAMAGSFGAIGAESAALGGNPAGIGLFRKTDFSFSLAMLGNITNSQFYNSNITDSKYNLNVPHLGLVATYNIKNESGWKTTNFGFTLNRNTTFHSRSTASAINHSSSLLDLYKSQIEDGNFDEFGSNLAWETYLIDVDTLANPDSYFTVLPNHGQTQTLQHTTKGSMSEIGFTFGANYNNRLYLGGTLGVPSVKYIRTSVYQEIADESDTTSGMNSFTLNERLTTTGSGINLKIGAIFRVHDYVRIGGAIHTPSFINLNDAWSAGMEADLKSGSKKYDSPSGSYDYDLMTPFRAIGSLGIIAGKAGLINVDYEYVDYSTARLSTTTTPAYSFIEENAQINTRYTRVGNLRVGTEWRVGDFRIRGGYALYGSPFSSAAITDQTRSTYAAGFGYRGEVFYADFAYSLTKYNSVHYLYDSKLVDPIVRSHSIGQFTSTVGFRF